MSVFLRNHKLKTLNLTGNPWNCDDNMQRLLKRLKQKRINVTISGCGMYSILFISTKLTRKMNEIVCTVIGRTSKKNLKIKSAIVEQI